jgi:hypothetical protein
MALRFFYFKLIESQIIELQEFQGLALFLKLTEYLIGRWTFNVRCWTFIFLLTHEMPAATFWLQAPVSHFLPASRLPE